MHNGLGMAEIHDMLINPEDTGTLYAAADGGVFRTSDAGVTWQVIMDQGAGWLAMDPGDPGHLLASSGEKLNETLDGGDTWTIITRSGDCPDNFMDVEFSRLESSRIYLLGSCAGQDGVFVSQDGGQTWSTTPYQG